MARLRGRLQRGLQAKGVFALSAGPPCRRPEYSIVMTSDTTRRGRNRRSMGRALVLAAIAISAFGSGGARAELLTTPVTGLVEDITGHPIANAVVSDGRQSVLTDAVGRYVMEQTLTSGFCLTASKKGFEPRSKCDTALPGTVVDFELPYLLLPSITPRVFTTVPQTLTLSVSSAAPSTGVCVTATDRRSTTDIVLAKAPPSTDGLTLWTNSFDVVSGTSVGTYSVDFRAVRCDTGVPLAATSTRTYVLDQAAPVIEMVRPVNGHRYVLGEDLGPSADGATRIVGPMTYTLDVSDDVSASLSLYVDGAYWSPLFLESCDWQRMGTGWSYRVSCGPYNYLTPGTYTFRATLTDAVGRQATTSRTFIVEA